MATNSQVEGHPVPAANQGDQGHAPQGGTEHVAGFAVSDHCRANDLDWEVLRAARCSQAWKLCALSLGLRPVPNIRRRLREEGHLDALNAYDARKEILRANLTGSPDPDRLQYELQAEGDGRERDPGLPATSRIVRLDRLYRFFCNRQISVHPRFAEIAGVSLAAVEPVQSSSVVQSPQQAPQLTDRADQETLVVGLLLMYVRELVNRPGFSRHL